MYTRVLAFDFDGTLARDSIVPPELVAALQQLAERGCALFLVTGRHFSDLDLGDLAPVFTGIVWENGAVLYHTAADELFMPFGVLDAGLIAAFEQAEMPMVRGKAIVATWAAHYETVWHVLNEWGGDAVVVPNKGSLMILPPGAAKGSGLERLLAICGFSARNLVSFGDGENDLSLLELAECGVAVADAVPALQAVANLVTPEAGPGGVYATLRDVWLSEPAGTLPLRLDRQIPLGTTDAGEAVAIPSTVLAGGNLGIFGDSGSGKSWVAGLLAEGILHAGYQVLLIDREGDFRGLRGLPNMITLECLAHALIPPTLVITVLEYSAASVVLDLCNLPADMCNAYLAELLMVLQPLRDRTFRPHWIVLEEAQEFAHTGNQEILTNLLPMLDHGWAFISYRPDWLAAEVQAAITHYLVLPLSQPEAVAAVQRALGTALTESPATIPHGSAWSCGHQIVRLRPHKPRVPHVRHFYKYLRTPLPAHKRFYFRTAKGATGLEASSLGDFLHVLAQAPAESLGYHQQRGDFAIWIAGTIGDRELAAQFRKLALRNLTGETLRAALLQRVAARYAALQAVLG